MHRFVLHLSLLLNLIILLFTVVCNAEYLDENTLKKAVKTERRFEVLTTTSMIYDILESLVDNKIKISQLISNGLDPHMYRPVRDDVVMSLNSDLIIYNGLYLEGNLESVFKSNKLKKKSFSLASFIEESNEQSIKEKINEYDPHIWMDVSIWRGLVPLLRDKLISLYPELEHELKHNAELLIDELNSLHEFGKNCIQQIPVEKRMLITTHDAFGYFGSAYGLEVHGIQGISTASQAGVRRIEQIINLIIEKQIPSIFIEHGISSDLVNYIVEGVRDRGFKIDIGGTLYTDSFYVKDSSTNVLNNKSLSNKESLINKSSYFKSMKHNFITISYALRGDSRDLESQNKKQTNKNLVQEKCYE